MLPQLRDRLWQFHICCPLERCNLAGGTRSLHSGLYASLGKPELRNRIAPPAEDPLASAHDGKTDALFLDIGDLRGAVGPHRGLNARLGRAGELDDAPL